VRKWIVAGLVAVLVVGGGVVYFASSSGSSDSNPVLITATAQTRDLRDEVTVQGTLGRVEERTINSASEASQVSRVYLDDGATLTDSEAILALDGRDSVTTAGALPFFRRLDVGAEGVDVAQLEATLKAAGYSPGTVDQRYTEQTRFALAQWQAAHAYPGAAPSTSQAVQVSLQQGAGYQLGDQTSAGLTIGPPPLARAAATSGRAVASTALLRSTGDVDATAVTTLTIASAAGVVNKGTPATFVVNASPTTHPAVSFTVSLSGTADANDVIAPAGPFTIPADAASTTFQILTRQNGLVEVDKSLVVTLAASADYSVGSPGSASTTIVSNDVPQLSLAGTTTVQPGSSATLTVTADQAPVHNTQVTLNAGGSAVPDSDYVAFPPTLTLLAGHTTVQMTVKTKTSTTVKPNRLLVVSLGPSSAYKVGPVATATITIAGTSGSAARPVVTITAGSLRTPAGQPASFTIGLDRALSDQLQVSVSYSGNAVAGSDYNPAGGLLVVPPGQTSLPFTVPTLDNGRVQRDPALFVTVRPDAAYVVGTPNTAGVVIVSATLPKISILGGPAAVGLGGGAVFTVVADQPPVKDISVQYTVMGTAQQGKDLEPVTGTVVLAAGETTASIPILTLNTNVYFLPTDMIAGTWPTRLGEVFVKEGDIVPAGTPLFSLTEAAFTVTLDASAADRTKLKVGQSVTVQLQGADGTAPGVITELDDNVTTDKETKKQTYKGKVQVQGTLGAADGAPVTIKVVVQERLGALTVPIAAVKQNGSGQDVVRVIDLANGGAIHEVRVTTGLSEGSYIEIKSGLRARQVVVVQLDKGSGG
jgi:multidrug efflux pump subunit AcrA (membrane-fusion protein)